MTGSLIIAKREINAYFNSASAYIFMLAFLLCSGILFFFNSGFFAMNQASLRGYFSLMPLVLSVFAPALTMKLWAEERRQGSYELLLTLPFSDLELVAGKFLASLLVVIFTLVLSLGVPLCASMFGHFDTGPIFSEYLGAILCASAMLAVGQAVSAASDNQISAFIVSVSILLVLSLLPQFAIWIKLPDFAASAINWLSLSYHFVSFARGVVDTRDVAYFALVSMASLFLASRFLAARKWS
ncbi:ABC transporter permease [Spirochaetota bacterium]